MINHIDVSSVLRRTVCDLYSNLVTRPTGAAVRTEIEQQLADSRGRTLTVIDFTNVNLLDFSCADEIVAKLLLRYGAQEARAAAERAEHQQRAQHAATRATTDDGWGEHRESYFIFRGLHEAHLDAIEAVLERHGLALVAEAADGGRAHLVGMVDDGERATWELLNRLGVAHATDVASAIGGQVSDAVARLDALCRRRLAMRFDESYVALGPAVEGRGRARVDSPRAEGDAAAGGPS